MDEAAGQRGGVRHHEAAGAVGDRLEPLEPAAREAVGRFGARKLLRDEPCLDEVDQVDGTEPCPLHAYLGGQHVELRCRDRVLQPDQRRAGRHGRARSRIDCADEPIRASPHDRLARHPHDAGCDQRVRDRQREQQQREGGKRGSNPEQRPGTA